MDSHVTTSLAPMDSPPLSWICEYFILSITEIWGVVLRFICFSKFFWAFVVSCCFLAGGLHGWILMNHECLMSQLLLFCKQPGKMETFVHSHSWKWSTSSVIKIAISQASDCPSFDIDFKNDFICSTWQVHLVWQPQIIHQMMSMN